MPTEAVRAIWQQLPLLVAPSWTDALPLNHQAVLNAALTAYLDHLATAVELAGPGEYRDEAFGRLYLAEALLHDLEVNL